MIASHTVLLSHSNNNSKKLTIVLVLLYYDFTKLLDENLHLQSNKEGTKLIRQIQ